MVKCPNTNFQFKCKQNNGKQVRPRIGLARNKRPRQTNQVEKPKTKMERKTNKNRKTTRSQGKVLQTTKLLRLDGNSSITPTKKQKTENPNPAQAHWVHLSACQGYLRPVCLFDLSVCDAHKKLSAISIVVQVPSLSLAPTAPSASVVVALNST